MMERRCFFIIRKHFCKSASNACCHEITNSYNCYKATDHYSCIDDNSENFTTSIDTNNINSNDKALIPEVNTFLFFNCCAEPGPDWPVAKMVWGEAWELHLYFFGGLFGLLGLYTLVSVLRLWSIHRLLSRRYFVSLNLLMLLLCSTRAVYLLLDGYNSNRTFHPSLDYFLYSISFPCLSSAFSIQLYALLQATKMQFLPPTIQKMSMLIVVTVFHFAISIATDVVVGMYAGMRIMLFVCQLFFILWGLFLFFGYAYIFRRLYLHAVKRQKNVIQKTGSYSMTGSIVKPKSKFTLSVAVKVTFSTAILGLVTVGLEVYGMVGVYKTFSDDQPEPWPFYIYHTTLRLIEFLMCASMSYVASQPFRYRRRRQCCCCPVLCAPCAEICCCGADVNRSNSLAGWSDIDQHQLRTSFDRGNVQNVSFQHDGVGNGHGITRNGSGGGDMTVAAKTRIYFKDRADVMPIVTSQPTSASTSRPTSANSDFVDENTMSTRGSRGSVTGSIDGTAAFSNPYRAVHSPSSDNRRFFPTSGGRSGVSTSTPVKARDGVVNIAYSSTTDDPQSPGFAGSKSRNGSIASSDFFHAPSVSLADSMASELDKAFRSMHEDETPSAPSNARAVSTPSLPSLDEKLEVEVGRKGAGGLRRKEPQPPPAQNGRATCPESSIQRFLQQQQQSGDLPAGMVLRRSRSAIGRCSFQEYAGKQNRTEAGKTYYYYYYYYYYYDYYY
nr:hypothetical protein BaRGS_030581 [Batillaria attramentaria]